MQKATARTKNRRERRVRPHGQPNTWDYRVFRRHPQPGEPVFEICEVYFDARGVGSAYCDATAQAESKAGLRREVTWFAEALEKPVIDETEIDPSEWRRLRREETVPLEELLEKRRRPRR